MGLLTAAVVIHDFFINIDFTDLWFRLRNNLQPCNLCPIATYDKHCRSIEMGTSNIADFLTTLKAARQQQLDKTKEATKK